ncbi:MAG: hypothetical protein ACTHJ6_03970, partial [Oryzihumus sp.]
MEPARRGSVLACALALVACLVMASATILAGSAGSQAAIAPFGPVSVRVSGTLLVARAESRHGARSYAVAVGHRVIPVQGP